MRKLTGNSLKQVFTSLSFATTHYLISTKNQRTMKRLVNLRQLLLVLSCLTWPVVASALTFDAPNEDGVTIRYQTTKANEVSVASGSYSGRVVIPSSVEYNGTTYAVTGISTSAFWMNNTLTSVVIPASVMEIGQQAFVNCESLAEVEIHGSLTIIPSQCFSDCYSLKSISLPSSVKMIQSSAFSNCGLTEVLLPPFLESIGQNAFHGCTSLKSVTLPESVSTIGDFAFSGCTNLSVVKSEIKVPFALNNVFFSISKDAILYVPTGTKAIYESTAGWNSFYSIIEMPDENAPKLTVSSATLKPGQKQMVSFSISNGETPIIGYQFDMALPEGIERTSFDDGYGGKINRDRCPDFTGRITSSPADGIYTFVAYSESNQPMVGSEGTVLSIMLLADENISLGTYQGNLSNIILVKDDNTKIYLDDYTFDIVVKKSILKGDVNGDGSVDVQDITEIAKYIVHQTNEIDSDAADMDEDGVIDVADITLVVKAIMTQSASSRMFGNTETSADALALKSIGNDTYAVSLATNNEYLASQFDIKVPAGATISDVMLNGSRLPDHVKCCERIAPDAYRIVIYSINNTIFNGKEGNLVTFRLNGEADNLFLENILFVDSDNVKNTGAEDIIRITGINDMEVSKDNNVWYTINGMKLSGKPSVEGVYVHNGKMVFVK